MYPVMLDVVLLARACKEMNSSHFFPFSTFQSPAVLEDGVF
jgi:hypothetical protein